MKLFPLSLLLLAIISLNFVSRQELPAEAKSASSTPVQFQASPTLSPVPTTPKAVIAAKTTLPKLTFRDGKFFNGSEREALKIAHLLVDFTNTSEINNAIKIMPRYKEKQYNAIQTTLYWQYFDKNWDGYADNKLALLNAKNFLEAVERNGFYTVLSFETYPVGGSIMGPAFFKRHPSAQAKNYNGQLVHDNEYLVNGQTPPVPSIFDPNYLKASRRIVRDLMTMLPINNVLIYETTVEPQYIGNQAIDYSDNALIAFNEYSGRNHTFETRPKPNDPAWNEFRAIALADWIDNDARNIRASDPGAIIAVDFLYVDNESQILRTGNPRTFLQHLDEANILQINWHYGFCRLAEGKYRAASCNAGYQLARQYAQQKQWGLMEHMGITGDLVHVDIVGIINNSIANGNTIGWNVVDAYPRSTTFSAYNQDLTPKGDLGDFDKNWITYRNQLVAGVSINTLVGKSFREFLTPFARLLSGQLMVETTFMDYRNKLANSSCQTVAKQLLQDPKVLSQLSTYTPAETLNGLTRSLLDRYPTNQESAKYLGTLSTPGSIITVAQELMTTAEYQNRCNLLGFKS